MFVTNVYNSRGYKVWKSEKWIKCELKLAQTDK